ncbi:MAG TPA: HNH endonuclease [Pirellulaceae bacterium]|nr:HNH endonuclease [Pirellulaceae bacterium]HMP71622.1 HNH endonuclease [Pirellulaceae bacterium]
MREYCLEHVPDAAYYANGLTALSDRITDLRRRIITAHYFAPTRRATAPQLAALASVAGGYPIVNAQYGGLGRAFCESTGFEPQIRSNGTPRWWGVWSKGYDHPDGFIWEMHDSVATALEIVGWVDPADTQHLAEELVPKPNLYREGACVQITVNSYERNRGARLACLNHYGYDCVVCGFNFVAAYGPNGKDFIHVHHIVAVSEIGEDYVVDPINDLRPVCPNCHAMIHRSMPMLTIDDLKQMVSRSPLQTERF